MREPGDGDANDLPALPQAATVRALAQRLWADARVEALWLGGSLASGEGDEYSDIDLRLAVAPAALAGWERPDLVALLGGEPLAQQFIRFSPHAFLHHLIAPNGDILDLVIRDTGSEPEDEVSLVLGCRDRAYAARLAIHNHAPGLEEMEEKPATADSVRDLLEAFWVNSHKHRKVLHRGLDLMFPAAAYVNWRMLMSLWYIAATGHAATAAHFSGIHGLTRLVRAVERDGAAPGADPLALLGMPCRTRAEICAAIASAQDAATEVGRRLAVRYPFPYPQALEDTVRAAWRAFRGAEG